MAWLSTTHRYREHEEFVALKPQPVGHLTVITGNIVGNLTKIFLKSQISRGLPGGVGEGRSWI